MFRNIIWDVDGTLFDTYPAIAESFRSAIEALGGKVSLERIDGLVRKSLSYCVTSLADDCGLNKDDIEEEFKNYYGSISTKLSPPFPGVISLCEHIKDIGGQNFIVTHRGRKGTTELLNAHNMSVYFSGAVVRDDGYARKPDPATFQAIIEKYELKLEETLTIGDREIDIVAGQRAGLFSCYFGNDSIDAKADLTVSEFDEVYEYIVNKNR